MHGRDLSRVGNGLNTRATPHDDRGHDETGTRNEIVQASQHGALVEMHADLFAHLSQRSLYGGLAGIETTDWKCPLAGVVAQLCGGTGEDQSRARLPSIELL